MATYTISVIPGDGIGPDVIREGLAVLHALGERCGHRFATADYLAGGAAIDARGVPLPEDTIAGVKDSHALLFGAIGGPVWVPKVYDGRNRTFFYTGYEQWRWVSSGSPGRPENACRPRMSNASATTRCA